MALTINDKLEALTYKAEDEKRVILPHEIGQYVLEKVALLNDEVKLAEYLTAKRAAKKAETIAYLQSKITELQNS